MSSLEVIRYDNMSPEARESVAGIKKKLGKIPNIYGVMAHSPAAVKAFLLFKDTLGAGQLSPREAEAIALVTAQETDCLYCLAAHTVISKMQGMTEEEIMDIRKAQSPDPKVDALARLTRDIISSDGNPSEENMRAFYEAGYSKGALVELVAQIALNIFTSYFNKIAQTPVDYPGVKKTA